MHNLLKVFSSVLLLFLCTTTVTGQATTSDARCPERLWLDSKTVHQGNYQWQMIKAGDVTDPGERLSLSDDPTTNWLIAIVPGTVLKDGIQRLKNIN